MIFFFVNNDRYFSQWVIKETSDKELSMTFSTITHLSIQELDIHNFQQK